MTTRADPHAAGHLECRECDRTLQRQREHAIRCIGLGCRQKTFAVCGRCADCVAAEVDAYAAHCAADPRTHGMSLRP